MNSQQTFSTHARKSNVNSTFGNYPEIQSGNPDISERKTEGAVEEELRVRLKKMEARNAKLERVVEKQTKKLAEVLATNSKFLSIIAHDLRTPLSSIIGVLEILKISFDDYNKTEIEKYLNLASSSAFGSLYLLDNLLAWAISQNKEKHFKPVSINLERLVSDEYESMETTANQKLISLYLSISPDIYVTADKQMVKTILRNLISNAIKYTHIGGEINVNASENGKLVEISVQDNGIGMSKKAQKELFGSDELNSTKGTDNETGTGLGLLLCREFIELHGGKLRIESSHRKGARFIFDLLAS